MSRWPMRGSGPPSGDEAPSEAARGAVRRPRRAPPRRALARGEVVARAKVQRRRRRAEAREGDHVPPCIALGDSPHTWARRRYPPTRCGRTGGKARAPSVGAPPRRPPRGLVGQGTVPGARRRRVRPGGGAPVDGPGSRAPSARSPPPYRPPSPRRAGPAGPASVAPPFARAAHRARDDGPPGVARSRPEPRVEPRAQALGVVQRQRDEPRWGRLCCGRVRGGHWPLRTRDRRG